MIRNGIRYLKFMEHYQHLVLKSLIKGGGSSSETYVHSILTGVFTKDSRSVTDMWGYLDVPLKEMLVDIFEDVCNLNLRDMTDSKAVEKLIGYMASKGGRAEFFSVYDRAQVEAMSDEKYELEIERFIEAKKALILEKEQS